MKAMFHAAGLDTIQGGGDAGGNALSYEHQLQNIETSRRAVPSATTQGGNQNPKAQFLADVRSAG